MYYKGINNAVLRNLIDVYVVSLFVFTHILPFIELLYSVTISLGRKNAACLSPNFQQFEEIDISRSRV